MYNVHGFGKRIATGRKSVGLTQEELAERLNITPQAVSKWENEVSFPEITILPKLAQVLGTPIDKLFGREMRENGEGRSYSFPAFNGPRHRLVHTHENVACYSEKEVQETTDCTVVFTDGSTANLADLEIINRGPGEIRFAFAEEIRLNQVDYGQNVLEKTFERIDCLSLGITNAAFYVIRSNDNQTRVTVQGSPVFIERLLIKQEHNKLTVRPREGNNTGSHDGTNNRVEIALACDTGEDLSIAVNGSGSADVKIPFRKGRLGINGSGSINADNFESLECKVNGSGDLSCGEVRDAQITVNGSGDVEIARVTSAVSAVVNGSGDVTLASGAIDTLSVQIAGSGDFDAKQVTTNKASLRVVGSGDVVVGRIIGESFEKHSRHSSITVLKRG